MKKMSRFGIASLIAAGAMLFATLGCDTGNDKYVEEIPTTWYSYSASGNGTCTAKWTFASDKSSIGAAEVSWAGKTIAPDSGEGATLTGGDPCAIKYVAPTGTLEAHMGESTGRIQAANKTASLSAPTGGASLVLETKEQTNITVRAKGAGAATSARIFLIKNEAGETLVSKDNLYSTGSNFIAFHVQGAPAGKYTIYFNGSTISEIDCNATGNTVSEPKAYTSNDDLTLSAAPTEALVSLVDTHTFTLKDAAGQDVTKDAVWTLLEGSDIATVKEGVVSAKSFASAGKVKARARIGRFYKDSDELTFEACTNQIVTTFLADNIPADSTKISDWASDDGKKVLETTSIGLDAVTVDEHATITVHDILKTDAAVALSDNNVSKGAGKGYQWKDASSSDVEVGTKYVSLTFKVTPKASSAKLSGIIGLVNCGKGANVMVGKTYINGSAAGTSFAVTKNNTSQYTVSFDTPVSITAETEITLTFETVAAKKGISLQLQDVGLMFTE